MHHYITCGLSNVWLVDGFRTSNTPYGPAIAISALPELYTAIAMALIKKPSALCAPEVRFLRKHTGLSKSEWARGLEADQRTVLRWETEEQGMPCPTEKLLRLFVRAHIDRTAAVREGVEKLSFDATKSLLLPLLFRKTDDRWSFVTINSSNQCG